MFITVLHAVGCLNKPANKYREMQNATNFCLCRTFRWKKASLTRCRPHQGNLSAWSAVSNSRSSSTSSRQLFWILRIYFLAPQKQQLPKLTSSWDAESWSLGCREFARERYSLLYHFVIKAECAGNPLFAIRSRHASSSTPTSWDLETSSCSQGEEPLLRWKHEEKWKTSQITLRNPILGTPGN